MAKDSLRRDIIDIEYYLNNIVLSRTLHMDFLRNWQEQWDGSTKGRPVWNLIREVIFMGIYSDYLNQVVTGHGTIPVHQARLFVSLMHVYAELTLGILNTS